MTTGRVKWTNGVPPALIIDEASPEVFEAMKGEFFSIPPKSKKPTKHECEQRHLEEKLKQLLVTAVAEITAKLTSNHSEVLVRLEQSKNETLKWVIITLFGFFALLKIVK
jgi:hypothetical protein